MEKNNVLNENSNLAKCAVCSGSISVNAEHCPHCGEPLNKYLPYRFFYFLCLFFPYLAVFPAGAFMASSNEDKIDVGCSGFVLMIISIIIVALIYFFAIKP